MHANWRMVDTASSSVVFTLICRTAVQRPSQTVQPRRRGLLRGTSAECRQSADHTPVQPNSATLPDNDIHVHRATFNYLDNN